MWLCLALQQESQNKPATLAPHFTSRALPSDHPHVTKPTCSSGNSQAPLTLFEQPVQGWFSVSPRSPTQAQQLGLHRVAPSCTFSVLIPHQCMPSMPCWKIPLWITVGIVTYFEHFEQKKYDSGQG